MPNLLGQSPAAFADSLLERGGRAAVVRRTATGELRVSHPELAELAEFLSHDERDFHAHQGVFFEVGRETGALHSATLHWTHRGQGAGGVRHWPYSTLEGLVRDGLRLSKGMTRKNALAGLWWGGGKGVIAQSAGERHLDPGYRRTLYAEYGDFVSSLAGAYVTAEDAGTTPPDMASVFTRTRHTTCIPPAFGGSGNPSEPTARGVVCAIEAALEFRGLGTLEGKTIAMEGAGNVAGFMLRELLARGVRAIVASEIRSQRIRELAEELDDPRLRIVASTPEDTSIFDTDCDIFIPNALGGSLNEATIPRLRAKIVCGAANNQLLDDRRDDRALHQRGITYVPDFLANRMGIVSCANEQYGSVPNDPAISRHFSRDWPSSIRVMTRRVLERSRDEGITTATAANLIADELAKEAHPLWPGRTRDIVEGLWQSRWHERRQA
ncbi:MAG: Glu/Leu/Phe/Val dehydrogenase dimerization domain-containing protein [Polyangiaceae bacterium]